MRYCRLKAININAALEIGHFTLLSVGMRIATFGWNFDEKKFNAICEKEVKDE